jgi:hypothetical protein
MYNLNVPYWYYTNDGYVKDSAGNNLFLQNPIIGDSITMVFDLRPGFDTISYFFKDRKAN